MPDAYTLSEADRQTFKEMVADWRARKGITELSGTPQDAHDREEFPTSPFYIARTGEFPIPAMSVDNVPGGAFCNIFSLLDGELVGIDGGEKLVYNIGATEVAKNSWCHVQREPSGAWFAISPAGGVNSNGGTSTCGPGIGWTAGLRPNSCLDMKVISQTGDCGTLEDLNIQHTLFYDPVQQWWALDPDLGLTFSIAGRQWTAKFQRATNGGLPTLVLIDAATVGSIGSFFGVLDCAGVDSNGNKYVEYVFGDPLICDGGGSGSGTGTTQCDNEVRIRLKCGACVTPVSDVVLTECCPELQPLHPPLTVYVTFFNTAGTSLSILEGLTMPISLTATAADGAGYGRVLDDPDAEPFLNPNDGQLYYPRFNFQCQNLGGTSWFLWNFVLSRAGDGTGLAFAALGHYEIGNDPNDNTPCVQLRPILVSTTDATATSRLRRFSTGEECDIIISETPP